MNGRALAVSPPVLVDPVGHAVEATTLSGALRAGDLDSVVTSMTTCRCIRLLAIQAVVRSSRSVAGHRSPAELDDNEYGARNDGELSVIFQSPSGRASAA